MQAPQPLKPGEEPRNWALMLNGKKQLAKEPRAFPDEPGPGMVQINVKACGICGSDLHAWESDGKFLGMTFQFPIVLGHEAAGIITKVGPGVENLKVGQAVAIHPWTWYALLCTHINHPAQLCVPLPDGVTCEQGSFVEPLAVGLNAVRRAGVKAGQNVAILGAGPVGLAALGCAKALGAAKVLITDLAPSRLDAAKNAGADVTLNVSGMKPIDVATAVTDALKTGAAAGEASVGLGEVELGSMDAAVDCVVDCAGFSDTLTAATYMVKPGGTISVVGLGTSAPSFPLLAGAVKEVTINPAFAYGPTGYADALGLIADGKVDVSKFISHRLKMDEAQRGFEMCFENKEGAVKVLFTTD